MSMIQPRAKTEWFLHLRFYLFFADFQRTSDDDDGGGADAIKLVIKGSRGQSSHV